MKIVLIGFMGAGKTTVAKLLAEKLKLEYIDMDTLIIKKSGKKSDKEIFESDGEKYFRELEIAVSMELCDKKNAIISTGGGIVMNKINMDYLEKNGIIIYLKNSFETSKMRIDKNSPPPLFQNENRAKKLFKLRQPLYTYYANNVIETDKQTAGEVVSRIIKTIKK